jgi:hypothetical protein
MAQGLRRVLLYSLTRMLRHQINLKSVHTSYHPHRTSSLGH